MVTKTVDVNKVEMSLKELLSLVREGTEIILTEDNISRARLDAIASQTWPLRDYTICQKGCYNSSSVICSLRCQPAVGSNPRLIAKVG